MLELLFFGTCGMAFSATTRNRDSSVAGFTLNVSARTLVARSRTLVARSRTARTSATVLQRLIVGFSCRDLIFLRRIYGRDVDFLAILDSFLVLLAPRVIIDVFPIFASTATAVIVVRTAGLFRSSASTRAYTGRSAVYINIDANISDLSGETSYLSRDRLENSYRIRSSCRTQFSVRSDVVSRCLYSFGARNNSTGMGSGLATSLCDFSRILFGILRGFTSFFGSSLSRVIFLLLKLLILLQSIVIN